MNYTALYAFMLAFDFGIFAGTTYLVSERGWSGWWFALAFVITMGSGPYRSKE